MRVVNGYRISGFDLETYCKITEVGIETPNYTCTMSFGTGMKKFCIIAKYSARNPYEIYIDRVEKNSACIIPSDITVDDATVKLVKIALWTMHLLYPHITKFTLFDDSQILCEDSKSRSAYESRSVYKLHLAYESILKYNKTWYQKNFGAELPGVTSSNNGKTITIATGSLMDKFNKSLSILDDGESIQPLGSIIDNMPDLIDVKDDYENAKSIRDFTNTLRLKYKDKYCFIVGKWLNRYMLSLGIQIYAGDWFIPVSKLAAPSHYKAVKLDSDKAATILNELRGGGGEVNLHKNKSNKKRSNLKWVNDEFITDSYIETMRI